MGLPRGAYFALAVFQSVAAAGCFFGFSSLARVLAADGVFSSLCGGAASAPCAAQAAAFADLYSYSALFALSMPVVSGALSDRFGPRTALRVFSAAFVAAIALLAYAAGARNDLAYYPAVMLLGCGASSNLIPLFSVAELFPEHKSLAISVLSGSFDAGAVVFLVLGALYDAGVPLVTLFGAYLAGPALALALLAVFVWPSSPFQAPTSAPPVPPQAPLPLPLQPGQTPPGREVAQLGGGKGEDEAEEAGEDAPPHTPLVASPRSERVRALEAPPSPTIAATAVVPAPSIGPEAAPTAARVPVVVSAPAARAVPAEPVSPRAPSAAERFLPGIDSERLKALPFLQQLRQPEFFLFLGAFCLWLLRFQTYIGTIDSFLTSLGQQNSQYTVIFGSVLPCGFVSVLVSGSVLDRHGPVAAFFILAALGIAVSLVSLVPVLALQPLGFALFACYRGFLYSVMSSYLALVFGFSHLGLLIGLVTLVGGCFALQQVAWTTWQLQSGFGPSNALQLVLGVTTLAFPMWLRVRAQRKR